ncbi:MAG: Ig domain-containing protein, partial [Parasphingorhabdus sp.]|uniref:Ig domain-containing protein n=1 Tax=Parasphingorhabdus sp. TaxID=2709688 RepID=UPI00329880A6
MSFRLLDAQTGREFELPDGVTFDSRTGELSGTHDGVASLNPVSDTVVLEATDVDGASIKTQFQLNVSLRQQKPDYLPSADTPLDPIALGLPEAYAVSNGAHRLVYSGQSTFEPGSTVVVCDGPSCTLVRTPDLWRTTHIIDSFDATGMLISRDVFDTLAPQAGLRVSPFGTDGLAYTYLSHFQTYNPILNTLDWGTELNWAASNGYVDRTLYETDFEDAGSSVFSIGEYAVAPVDEDSFMLLRSTKDISSIAGQPFTSSTLAIFGTKIDYSVSGYQAGANLLIDTYNDSGAFYSIDDLTPRLRVDADGNGRVVAVYEYRQLPENYDSRVEIKGWAYDQADEVLNPPFGFPSPISDDFAEFAGPDEEFSVELGDTDWFVSQSNAGFSPPRVNTQFLSRVDEETGEVSFVPTITGNERQHFLSDGGWVLLRQDDAGRITVRYQSDAIGSFTNEAVLLDAALGIDLFDGAVANLDDLNLFDIGGGKIRLAAQDGSGRAVHRDFSVIDPTLRQLGPGDDTETAIDEMPLFADGGEGEDTLTGWAGPDILVGGPDNDLLVSAGGPDILLGEDGDDVIDIRPTLGPDGEYWSILGLKIDGGPGQDRLILPDNPIIDLRGVTLRDIEIIDLSQSTTLQVLHVDA